MKIEFRAWDKKLKTFSHEAPIMVGLKFEEETKRFIFQQYTGLKDKNNKKIYKGDKLRVIEISDNKEFEYETDVIFEEGSFLVKDETGDYNTFLSSWFSPEKRYPLIEYEIIGHINER